ncbi:MAG: hypothetical protein JSS98_04205 [Bacteroidetes bacterium]|nr:hypothetical protein [Bacteroidota bacterium]
MATNARIEENGYRCTNDDRRRIATNARIEENGPECTNEDGRVMPLKRAVTDALILITCFYKV